MRDLVAADACLSADRAYRYWLTRIWSPQAPALVVIGLNPSTADERTDDPTIRKVCGFARRWSFGGVVMLNLFGFRSTDPAGLAAVVDPIGPENDQVLTERTAGRPRPVLCAWGAGGAFKDRGPAVARLLRGLGRELVCLGLTKGGHPMHPLYLANTTPAQPFVEVTRG